MVVLSVSMGMRKMRHRAATADAPDVFTSVDRSRVSSYALKISITPALAAVSPKRDSGPCSNAGARPR